MGVFAFSGICTKYKNSFLFWPSGRFSYPWKPIVIALQGMLQIKLLLFVLVYLQYAARAWLVNSLEQEF